MAEKRPDVDPSGRTAIVTGGGRGIGKAVSLALALAGANVIVAARSEEDSPGRLSTATPLDVSGHK